MPSPKHVLRKAIRVDLPGNIDTKSPYFPIYAVTGVMGCIFIIGPLIVKRGPHRGVIRWSIMLTVVCLWLFWVTIYIAQINPLLGPRLSNASLAWVGYCWGDDAKKLGAPDEPPPAAPEAPPEDAPEGGDPEPEPPEL